MAGLRLYLAPLVIMTKSVPYFPIFAANIIASKPFRLMTMKERGLWITIQMECWVNGAVPSSHDELSKYLGILPTELNQCFTPIQMSFLEKKGLELKSPELEEYRKGYLERREKQRLGGLDGAKRKKAKQEAANKLGIPEGPLSYFNSNQISSNPLISNGFVEKRFSSKEIDEWVSDYENAEDAKY